jgi:methylmalonyl-CoA mutase N-terminal domain/subunit
MAPIDDAIAELESLQPGEKLCYTTTADKHGMVQSTLMRRYTGQTRARDKRNLVQRKLNPQQEDKLILYIEHLTRQGLPPTRYMVQNFAATIA